MGACILKSSQVLKLSNAKMDQHLKRREYERQLAELQSKLTRIQQAYLFSGRSAVIVFEGWDAAGKGGHHPAHLGSSRS